MNHPHYNPVVCFLLILFVLASCKTERSRLETALTASGENRQELEKVLDFYSQNPQDSLKLKAAIFLIENMPGHTSLSGEPLSLHQQQIANVLARNEDPQEIENLIRSFRFTGDLIKNDMEVISSELLISNIERSFKAWKENPWSKHLSFGEFCEYILPYKYAEGQVLDDWREKLSDKFNKALSTNFVNDENYHSVYQAGYSVNREINSELQVTLNPTRLPYGSSFFCSGLIDKIPFGDCEEYTSLILATMRSHGIPATIDYIPQWGHRSSGNHRWIVLLNNNGTHLPIPHIHQDPGDVFFPMHVIPKIYRNVYVPDEERSRYVRTAHYIFNPLTCFSKDVTAEYVPVADISVPVGSPKLTDPYVYIACSFRDSWNVIDFGVLKNRQAHFRQMGKGVIYMVLGYKDEKLLPLSEPFLLDGQGEIRFLIPDTTSLQDITLRRKYPKAHHTAHMESRLLGGRIEATNDATLTNWETLYEIKDDYYPDLIPVEGGSRYRYWRFHGRQWAYLNIAEFQLFKKGTQEPLTGKVIVSQGAYEDNPGYAPSNAFDGDWLTTYLAADNNLDSWIGLDLGSETEVGSVRCVARSDDNGIHYGDTYELVYWSTGKWISLGTQTARERFLVFKDVPRHALLLLKNHTRGIEERIFTWEEGAQKWW